jgi:hypothetical protein
MRTRARPRTHSRADTRALTASRLCCPVLPCVALSRCAVTPEARCLLAVSLTTSCVIGAGGSPSTGVSTSAIQPFINQCAGAASTVPALCAAHPWATYMYAAVGTLLPQLSVSSTAVENLVQLLYRVVYHAQALSPSPGCDAIVPGLRVGSGGQVLSSVCPSLQGLPCVSSVAAATSANGMKFYTVSSDVRSMTGYNAASDSLSTCPAV